MPTQLMPKLIFSVSKFVRWAAQADGERFRECVLDHRPPCRLHELREVCLASLVRRCRRKDGRDAAQVEPPHADAAHADRGGHTWGSGVFRFAGFVRRRGTVRANFRRRGTVSAGTLPEDVFQAVQLFQREFFKKFRFGVATRLQFAVHSVSNWSRFVSRLAAFQVRSGGQTIFQIVGVHRFVQRSRFQPHKKSQSSTFPSTQRHV